MASIRGVQEEINPPLLLGKIREYGLDSEIDAIYGEVLSSKPTAIKQNPALKFLDIEATYPRLIEDWHGYPQTVEYDDSKPGVEKLIKHAIKYHLHTEYQWQSIGEAEYMTGDATGLALAPLVDPRITVKILHGSQRKIRVGGSEQNTHPDGILAKIKEHGLLGDLEVLFGEVLRTFPGEAVQDHRIKFLDIEQELPGLLDDGLVRTWFSYAMETEYEDSKQGYEEILKEIIAFYLNRNFSELTKARPKKLTIFQRDEFLPDYFRPAQGGGNIRFSNTDFKRHYAGTSDRYALRYNEVVERGQVMPWNKETWVATEIIGRGYRDEESRRKLQEQMLPAENSPKREGVQRYKQRLDETIEGKKCVFLWGRTSGAKGGAHPELDSHADMMLQLARTIHDSFADRMLIVVGDEVVGEQDLLEAGIDNHLLVLGEFWNDPDFKDVFYGDRNAQRYLFKLFDEENAAVSLGMRSGSLEGMALLGLKVIFMDDRGNNAAERMEFWAGDAADTRAGALRLGREQAEEFERQHQGPMANYKRIATYQQTGSKIEARNEILAKAEGVLDRALRNDATGRPIATAEGNPAGNEIVDSLADYEATVLARRLPESPETLQEFYRAFATCVNKIEASGAWGRSEVREGSAFRFNRADLEAIIEKLERVPVEEHVDEHVAGALEKLRGLSELTDLLDEPLVHEDETSKPAAALLRSFEGKEVLESVDAEAFNTMYGRMSRQFPGKEKPAQPGTMKFRRPDIERLVEVTAFLKEHNLLQAEELQQATFLISYLSPDAG